MSIPFPRRSEFSGEAAPAGSGWKPEGITDKEFLYLILGRFAIAILVFFFFFGARGFGQGDKPQLKRPEADPSDNKPQEKKKPKVKGPRAVGILQLNSSGKGTLVPVAILVDGRFYDASAYKADPIPMALESGTVYEAEQAGEAQGLFTISGALRSKTEGSVHPWLGSGTYLPEGAEAPKGRRKAEDVPVGVDNSGDEPPRLIRKDSSKTASSGSGEGASRTSADADKASGKGAGSGQGTDTDVNKSGTSTERNSAEKSGSEKSDQSGSVHASSAGSTTTGSDGASSSSGQSTASAANSQADDAGNYYRPTLRRGKPTQGAPEEESLAAKKVDKPDAPKTGAAADAGIRTVAAISDAGGPLPQSYKFFWKTGEEEERRNQMLALVESEVRGYASALVRNRIGARPASTKTGSGNGKESTKQVPPVLENVQFRAFDLWLTNQLVMIITAEAYFPVVAQPTAAPEKYSVTLVARTDIYGNLRKLYSGVTDKFHLDVTPQLELIDVIDVDGEGRGELLFRETSDVGNGYLIYRVTPDKLWKMFDSLNAE